MAYSDKVLDHYDNPRNVGSLDKSDPSVGTGICGAPACGDVMKLQIKVENDVIVDAKFKTYGCLTSNSQIATPTKYKKIKDLKEGDIIWAWNGKKIVKNKIKKINKTYRHFTDLIRIDIGLSRKIICTKDHIWWSAKNKPIEACDLKPGDELLSMTESELRSINNVGMRDWMKELASETMKKTNDSGKIDHALLPQNQKGWEHSDEAKKKISEAAKKNWENPEYVKNWQKGMVSASFNNRPTSLEYEFIKFFDDNNVDVRYVGDSSFWVNCADGTKINPDFKVNGQRKLLEVYTSKLPKFMQDRSNDDWSNEKNKLFKSKGFDCLFLDIKDIDNCLQEVQKFIHNGLEIKEVKSITNKLQIRGLERDGEQVAVYDIELEEGANIFFVFRAMSHNCGSAIASSSLITEWIKGMHIDKAVEISNGQIAKELSLPPVKIHCSVLAEDAIKAAIEDYKKKSKIS